MRQKIVCKNKRAFHDYHIEETIEAGIVLKGSEVKSLRTGRANLKDGYAQLNNGEIFLYNVHISPYAHATYDRVDPVRVRKLLLNRREIRRLIGKLHEKGLALIPLKLYFIGNGKVKVELGLARGKKLYDKRASLKEKQTKREMERDLRRRDG